MVVLEKVTKCQSSPCCPLSSDLSFSNIFLSVFYVPIQNVIFLRYPLTFYISIAFSPDDLNEA